MRNWSSKHHTAVVKHMTNQITERLRDPRGLRRGGLAGNNARNVGPSGVRTLGRGRGFVRNADRLDSEEQPPAKKRLCSAVVKVEDGEIIEDDKEKEGKGQEQQVDEKVDNSQGNGRRSDFQRNYSGLRRDNQRGNWTGGPVTRERGCKTILNLVLQVLELLMELCWRLHIDSLPVIGFSRTFGGVFVKYVYFICASFRLDIMTANAQYHICANGKGKDHEAQPVEHVPRVLPKDEDPSLVKRNRRMLGQLLGTLEGSSTIVILLVNQELVLRSVLKLLDEARSDQTGQRASHPSVGWGMTRETVSLFLLLGGGGALHCYEALPPF
eukprot:Gb_25268 [translate_table: standard]